VEPVKPPSGIREHVPLAPLTTLGVGGEARFYLEAEDEPSVVSALAWARASGVSRFILGGGSNVLISDRGLDGLVVRVGVRGIKPIAQDGHPRTTILEVGAGEPFDLFVEGCVRASYGGLECLSGIPGLVGATPIQNVGAYGQEVGERIVSVRVLRRSTGQVTSFDRAACRFSYRSSLFKEEGRDAFVVLAVTLALTVDEVSPIRYSELADQLAARGKSASSLADIRETVLAVRRSKSMVIDEADPNRHSVGSFFVNPVVPSAIADQIERRAGAGMPRFAAGEKVKLSAAWLIERAGFPKGTADGAVGVSTRHALAIVNRGGATAGEILRFAGRIRSEVWARFGVALVPEPVLLGFEPAESAALA
jgi:UDP-N-acetylmuramate dehydrogenase